MRSLAQLADGLATGARWAEGKCQGQAEVVENQSRAEQGKGQGKLAENFGCLAISNLDYLLQFLADLYSCPLSIATFYTHSGLNIYWP